MIYNYVLDIIFLLGYISLVVAIFTSGYSASKNFVLLGTLTTTYCPFTIVICKYCNYLGEEE